MTCVVPAASAGLVSFSRLMVCNNSSLDTSARAAAAASRSSCLWLARRMRVCEPNHAHHTRGVRAPRLPTHHHTPLVSDTQPHLAHLGLRRRRVACGSGRVVLDRHPALGTCLRARAVQANHSVRPGAGKHAAAMPGRCQAAHECDAP